MKELSKCARCKSKNIRKNGIVWNKQRYKCKDCEYNFTVASRGKSLEIKRLALHMYLEGLGFRSIDRILEVSNVAVLKWIKAVGKDIIRLRDELSQSDNESKRNITISTMELDEMWHYVGKKNYKNGFGLLLTVTPKMYWDGKSVVVEQRQD